LMFPANLSGSANRACQRLLLGARGPAPQDSARSTVTGHLGWGPLGGAHRLHNITRHPAKGCMTSDRAPDTRAQATPCGQPVYKLPNCRPNATKIQSLSDRQ
jgi:hypothetical protein